MHANLEQLLQIRDGEETEASSHVRDCQRCQQELVNLGDVAQHMFLSAENPIPTGMWQRIEGLVGADQGQAAATHAVPLELLSAQRAPKWNSLSAAVYTLAFSIFMTGMIVFYGNSVQRGDSSPQSPFLAANMTELMLNSRGLEQVLQRASLQNELLSDSERELVERLHWRLMLVDQQIQEFNSLERGDPESTRNLWSERIDALNELNQLYYQASYEPQDSEI